MASAAVLVAACTSLPSATPATVRISGAIYTDFRVDAPCDEQPMPEELSGVTITFSDAAGTELGRAVTTGLQAALLDRGPGTEGWLHPGCRFYASYEADVRASSSYVAAFGAPDPEEGPGEGYFSGVADLEPVSMTHDELAAAGFVWTFEAQPSYVVP